MNFIEEKIIARGNTDNLKFRFPPDINAPGLHIGHAKSICLNFGMADRFNSPCILRFDDTNPLTGTSDNEKNMLDDVLWLGFNPSEITHASDNFTAIHNIAIHMIKSGKAYVDPSTSEEIAATKGTPTTPGMGTIYRNRPIEDNFKLFEEMTNGIHPEGSMVLRAKIDMASPNMILRDPIIYRIVDHPHHRTGSKWKVYPTYDMAHPLCDMIEEISDSLCTLEFEIHRPLYEWVLDNCGINMTIRPIETEFARLNIENTVMSKRLIKTMIELGEVTGWDDPSLFTIAALRKRGFTPNSIKEFCNKIGVTKRESIISTSLLEECLRDDLNKTSHRMMAVSDPVRLVLTDWNRGVIEVDIENNPEDPNSGSRKVLFSGIVLVEREDFCDTDDKKFFRLKPGGDVRLKGATIVNVTDYDMDINGMVTEIRCTHYEDCLGMKVKGTIHWVDIEYNYVLNVLEDRVLNEVLTERIVADLTCGSTVQFIRKGYYTCMDNSSMVKTVGLRSSWK